MSDKEFEIYWLEHREEVLARNKEWLEAKDKYKMRTGADWLLFGIPVVAGLVFLDRCPVKSELLKWLLSAVVIIICFALCVWVWSLLTGARTPDDVERDIKRQLHDQMTGQ